VKKAEKKQGAQSAPTQSSSYADPNKIFVGGFVRESISESTPYILFYLLAMYRNVSCVDTNM